MSAQPLPKPHCHRETRLGLVVYGGVALAVYMNGVCREFYDATHGRRIYKLFKALTDSDIVVDIISGTSAGGINGVLLSYATANERDFAQFANIWRQSGDINHLLRQPREGQDADSLLDGQGYYQDELEAAFRGEVKPSETPPPSDDWPSPACELDLFVTGTDVSGRIQTVLDDTGAAIEIKDHRTIFQLKHRPGRREPFRPHQDDGEQDGNTYAALAKLCRITSCFPAAFPVVSVPIADSAHREADRRLVDWGQLNRRWLPDAPPQEGYQLHFVDGGVLDNRPFSYAIEAIYYRTANRPVDRKLFYIDPNPDRFLDSPNFREMPRPTIWQAVQESLIGMPSYESINDDLQAIQQHNEKVRRYRVLLSELERQPLTDDAAAAPESEAAAAAESTYRLSRLVSLRDRALPFVLGLNRDRLSARAGLQQQTALAAIAQLIYTPSNAPAANPQAEICEPGYMREFSRQVLDLDVEYALRKHFHVIRKLRQRAEAPELPTGMADNLQLLAERLNRQLRLLEILRASLEQCLACRPVTDYFQAFAQQVAAAEPAARDALRQRLHGQLIRLHQFWLCPDRQEAGGALAALLERFAALPHQAGELPVPDSETRWFPQAELTDIFNLFKRRLAMSEGAIATLLATDPPQPAVQPLKLLAQVDAALSAILATDILQAEPELRGCDRAFRTLDRQLYPFELLAGLREKQLIATVRISPSDAQRGFGRGKGVEEKLAGDSLRAFGGFFKRSWRSNDILWGRLDGLNRLADGLLTPATVAAHFPRFVQRERPDSLTTRDYLTALLAEALPQASAQQRAVLLPTLERLAHAPATVTADEFEDWLDRVVRAGQEEILHAEVPVVMQDAIAEQLSWSQQKVQTDGDKLKYLSARGAFNQTVTASAIAQLVQDSWQLTPETAGRPSVEQVIDFFERHYNVGREEIKTDLPAANRQLLATRALLVLRDILRTLFARFDRTLTYRLTSSLLQTIYWRLQAQQSGSGSGTSWWRWLFRFVLLLGAIAVVAIAAAALPRWVPALVLALLLARMFGLWRWLRQS